MPEEFDHLNEDEKLKAENEFLKMKLMLEKGASFGSMETESELPPQIENQFLNYITEFEKQSENPRSIRLFDKIERPAHFKPVAEIQNEEMDAAWKELSGYLNKYQISLDVCSPNISTRELYRFTTEELFEQEMDDMSIPGMTHGFIYDEFHPDPVYDNTKAATEDCINYILEKRPIEWTPHFNKENLRLNQHHPLTIDQFKNIVNQFKFAYDELEINEITGPYCVVNMKDSLVSGTYKITATVAKETVTLSGQWKVLFERDEELSYWYITEVNIEGIAF
jgi:hypothetical protein